MNFYSDIIMNDIMDNYPLEKVIDSIEQFGEECFNAIAKYSYNSIHHKYIYNVLGNMKNIVAFHCLDCEFSINNCPSMLVYRKCKCKDETRYYVLIACTYERLVTYAKLGNHAYICFLMSLLFICTHTLKKIF
jgi:hypothetical protein